MAYAETDELARVLKIRTPTSEQTAALERVLDAATAEINAEIDLAADTLLTSEQTAIAEQVCLQRASELWFLQEVPLGVTGLGSDIGPTHLASDSWRKYSIRLASLKDQQGFA